MGNKLLGLTSIDVRKLAFDFAEKIKIHRHFNRIEGLAGKDWLRSFMRRHDFAHRKAEHTSAARATGFNKETVKLFFNLLEDVLKKHNFTPDRIYNVDETGISVVPKSSPKIIAKRGKRQVGRKTVAERGEAVTAEICMSAAGVFMPPMLIFPRVSENPKLLHDAPPGAWAEFHKTGYMQTDIFTRWFEKFITFSQARSDNPVLLLLDGHVSHIKNIKVIDLARDNGVEILCFPPHCTHKMQPLDVGFVAPLNSYFGKEISTLQQQHVSVKLENLFSVIGKSFIKAAKMETGVNSFRKCGIWPFNADIFTETDFTPSTREDSFLTNDTNNSEFEAGVAEFSEIIKQITSTNAQSTQSNNNQCTINSQPAVECNSNTERNNVGGEVQIPLSYVLQAKPLINFLSSCLDSNSVCVPLDHLQSDAHIQLPLSIIPQVPTQIQSQTQTVEAQTSSAASNMTASNEKKARAKGKACLITSDQYKEALAADKIKKIKKETTVKKTSVPKIKSNVLLSKPYVLPDLPVPESRKRKQSPLTTKKRIPFANLENQELIQGNTVKIIDSEMLPLQEGEYFLQEDGYLLRADDTQKLSVLSSVPM